MERMRVVEGVEEEEDEGLPFLLKDWSDSCLVIASITVVGTFTADKKKRRQKLFGYAGVLVIHLVVSRE